MSKGFEFIKRFKIRYCAVLLYRLAFGLPFRFLKILKYPDNKRTVNVANKCGSENYSQKNGGHIPRADKQNSQCYRCKNYCPADIPKEALNKSRHASCLHIFRRIARKICLRNLHTRFNQRFLKISRQALCFCQIKGEPAAEILGMFIIIFCSYIIINLDATKE